MGKVLKSFGVGKAILILVIFLIGLAVFKIINLNSAKKPIIPEKFKSYMEAKGYTVTEVESELETKVVLWAENDAEEYKIKVVLCEFLTTEKAEEFYETKKTKFENESNDISSSFGWETKNYSKYHLNKNDEYQYKNNDKTVLDEYKIVYRVDNVVMYSDVNIDKSKVFSSNKDEVEKIFKNFGY